MGGAERGERKRKQQAAVAAQSEATRPGPAGGVSRRAVAAVGVAMLIVLVVGAGIWLQVREASDALPPTVPLAKPGPQYPVTPKGDTVVTGKPGAPVTIDIYEDFLCPACGQFEKMYGQRLDQAAASGQAHVVYHPIAILDAVSEPPGYSSLAAGGAFCAAQAGVFPRYHDSLYATQPTENEAGWTSAQLTRLGRDLGAGDGFARCLDGSGPRAVAATEKAGRYLSTLRPDGRVGTPTVVVDGVAADTGDEQWLDRALAGARR